MSALIVNYNVKELLLDCLRAVHESADIPLEVVVVDNASGDGSAEAAAQAFPTASLVRLEKNIGYGRANNAGLEHCHGRFILLLNPDVTVAPDTAGRLADFLLTRRDVGAVGPRLLRQDGSLDRAARRAFPSPAVAFYRMTGLSHVFPTSPRFGRYNMGHVPDDITQEIDAGIGACLMLRRGAIDKVGFFDPDYFMYGEDLDLCFRLKETGWKVFYLPSATAVHVKGAATRQATMRMLFEFHRAMWTFHTKHYAEDMAAFGNGLVWAGIWLRWAVLSMRASLTGDTRISP